MALLTIADLLRNDADQNELVERAMKLSSIYDDFVTNDRGDTHERAPGIHASEISGCERKIVYSLLSEPRVEKSALPWKRRFKVGHAIHAMFQRDFERMAKRKDLRIFFQDEVTIEPCMEQPLAAKWQIFSHTDGIFTISDESGPIVRCILEIKTESPDGYEKLMKPKPEHIEQGHVYMACLDVPLIWYLYYNKGNQNYTGSNNPSFFLKFDPKVWQTLEDRFDRVHTKAALNVLPERQEGVVCEFCAFSTACNPAYLNRKSGIHKPPSRWSKP